MGLIKAPNGSLRLSIIACAICTFVLVALLYTETITSLSPSTIFKFKTCSKPSPSKPITAVDNKKEQTGEKINREDKIKREEDKEEYNAAADDRFEFDPNECSVAHGKWVFNASIEPLYSDTTCPYLDRQFSCVKNGRLDTDYQHWEWQPDDCVLPRFDPKVALEKLRGKRLMFVGDSLQRNQWQSFVCLVESIVPEDQKVMKQGRSHSIFSLKEMNATIEFYWAPFLIESNSDNPGSLVTDPNKRILKVDSVSKHAKMWKSVDILAFNSYVWWLSNPKARTLWGSFANGEEGVEELDMLVAYRIGLKTWANWIDSYIDPNTTRVFFTTMSPTHSRSADWNHNDGIKCFNETRPVLKKGHWGTGSNKNMMRVVSEVIGKMKFPISVINITQLSEYRIDGHASIYNELAGKLLTKEQRADPLNYADCIHWCLPGVPDTWNQILLAYL